MLNISRTSIFLTMDRWHVELVAVTPRVLVLAVGVVFFPLLASVVTVGRWLELQFPSTPGSWRIPCRTLKKMLAAYENRLF